MNTPGDKNGTGPEAQAPNAQQKLVGLLVVVAMIAALVAAYGYLITPRPANQADAESVAVQDGTAAFKAGAYEQARQILEPLAMKGNAQAAYWLGQMYEEGLGVKRDANTAITWYRKAAEGGWKDARLQLGEIYFQGTEGLQDFKKARKWLEQAARDGHAQAQLDLGKLYAKGWGGDKDAIQAYVWYEFAARQGYFEARELRDALLKTMQESEITQAQTLAEKMASEIFGQGKDDKKDGKAPDAIDKK